MCAEKKGPSLQSIKRGHRLVCVTDLLAVKYIATASRSLGFTKRGLLELSLLLRKDQFS